MPTNRISPPAVPDIPDLIGLLEDQLSAGASPRGAVLAVVAAYWAAASGLSLVDAEERAADHCSHLRHYPGSVADYGRGLALGLSIALAAQFASTHTRTGGRP